MSDSCQELVSLDKAIRDMLGKTMYPVTIWCDNKSAKDCTEKEGNQRLKNFDDDLDIIICTYSLFILHLDLFYPECFIVHIFISFQKKQPTPYPPCISTRRQRTATAVDNSVIIERYTKTQTIASGNITIVSNTSK